MLATILSLKWMQKLSYGRRNVISCIPYSYSNMTNHILYSINQKNMYFFLFNIINIYIYTYSIQSIKPYSNMTKQNNVCLHVGIVAQICIHIAMRDIMRTLWHGNDRAIEHICVALNRRLLTC